MLAPYGLFLPVEEIFPVLGSTPAVVEAERPARLPRDALAQFAHPDTIKLYTDDPGQYGEYTLTHEGGHILDAAELTFPFQESTLFRGLEQYPELLTEPRSLRDSYLQQIEAFVHDLKRGCRDQNIDYVQLRTDTPLNVALSSYLAHRLTRSK